MAPSRKLTPTLTVKVSPASKLLGKVLVAPDVALLFEFAKRPKDLPLTSKADEKPPMKLPTKPL